MSAQQARVERACDRPSGSAAMFLAPPQLDHRRVARGLYWQGWPVSDIARHLELPIATVGSWKSRDKWDETPAIQRVESSLEARFIQLIAKDPKSGSDYKEIDLLGRQIERLARVRRYGEPGGHEGDLNPKVGARNAAAAQKRPVRNHFDEEAAAKLEAAFFEGLFGYQHTWFNSSSLRTRVILKSRQIGATWYFAREALLKAVKTGHNQIFLSASKSQAHVFRQYIVAFAREACGVELTGDPITLSNGAILYFLGTNARTAQGYHGDFYFDEFFWTFRFQELEKVASGMALHKKWRKTYFSTPSSINHEAFPFWNGDLFNRRRPKAERVALDVSWGALKDGALGFDRKWRQIVTIEDAQRQGCDLFDIDELRLEYAPDDFANLMMCQFIDDTLSVFPLALMQPCLVDSWDEWADVLPHLARPYAGPVWIGYDPSSTGDSAALVVVAPPTTPGGKFRILEKLQWRGMDYEGQAAQIRRICGKYHVEYIGIDATGIGDAVYQLVRNFFPAVRRLMYAPELKVNMVLKAHDTIRRGRLQYDAGWTELTQSFMAIRKTLTGSGRSVTYEAGRTEETGHADLAWAVMHTLINEPLDATSGGGRAGFMEIYG